MKRLLKPVMYPILMVVFIFLPTFLFAQTGGALTQNSDPGDPGCDPLCNCRADGSICPIDNGLYVLLAIGVGYGIIKARNLKKVKQ